MNRKALFFDIDGTIISEVTKQIPNSTIQAISEAKKKGHLTFINSGRTWCSIPDILQKVDFDGYLCGCGTYIICQEKVLFSVSIPPKLANRIIEELNICKIDGVFEGVEDIYFKKEPHRFKKTELLRSLSGKIGLGLSAFQGIHDIFADKFIIYADEQSDKDRFFSFLTDENFEIIDRKDDFYEIVPKPYSKATAIKFILNRYNIPLSEAYVFGDSTNDLPMFTYIPNAIALGDHDKDLEPYTSFITKKVEEDGIYYAMKQLNII